MNKEEMKKFALIFSNRLKGAEISISSVMIAYYILLSLFPLVIAGGNILSMFSIDTMRVLAYMDVVVPRDVQPLLESLVINLLDTSNTGLLSLSAVGLLWTASRGINYLQKGMNKAYGVQAEGNFIIRRLLSLLIVLLLFVLLIVFLVVFSLGSAALDVLAPTFEWAAALNKTLGEIKWPTTFAFLFAVMLLLYLIAPDVRLRIREAVPGALFSMLGLAGLVQAYTLYLRFVTRSFSSYGTLGAFFLLMFWLNFSAGIVVLGSVLNAAIREYRLGPAEARTERIDDYFETRLHVWLQRRKQAKKTEGPKQDAAEGGESSENRREEAPKKGN